MAQRILLAGSPGPRSDALAAALAARGVQARHAPQPAQAGEAAAALLPHAVVLDAPLQAAAGQAWLLALADHPATAGRPVLALGDADPTTALAALTAGVVALLSPERTPEELADALVAMLGADPDAAAAALAVRTGPALLRRAFVFLAENGCTGRLLVSGLAEPAAILLEQGQPRSAAFGPLRGPAALDRLLSDTSSGWTLRFAPGTTRDTGEAAALAGAGETIALGVSAFPPLPPPSPEATAKLPPARVLLVDPDPAAAAALSSWLTRAGWAAVQVAPGGEQALELARSWRPELVVSDITVPELNGWDLLGMVRADFKLRETRFALFSGHSEQLQALERIQAGADGYIDKSTRPEAVVRELERLLAPRRDLQAALKPGERFSLPFMHVGVQALLLCIAQAKLSGVATLEDGFAVYRLGFHRGLFGAAQARVGEAVLAGRDALRMLLGAEEGRVFFDPRQRAEPHAWGKPLPALLDELSAEASAQLEAGREELLQRTVQFAFDPEALELYRRVMPAHALGVVDELAAGWSPRALRERPGAHPALVDWVVKDLLRKGVGALAQA